MLTPKDIRDIAAYWGAPYSYIDAHAKRNPQQGVVDGLSLHIIADEGQREHEPMLVSGTDKSLLQNFKLHLRELKSLTWEEWVILWRLLHGYDEDYVPEPYQTMARFLDDYYEGKGQICLKDMAGAIAYLQHIGVYVPNTLREELVELIN